MTRFKKLLALGLALVVAELTMLAPAIALNVDQSRTPVVRFFGVQAVHYYRFTLNYNDPRVATTAQIFGAMGQLTYIQYISCNVTTAFNAGTTNTMSIGTSLASANEIMTTAGVTLTATGATFLSSGASLPGAGVAATTTSQVTLYVKLNLSGTAATAGSVTCIIAFAPNNDM